ncbi:hypothetical protein HanRHA438_Chr16g0762891 [Helianthus annuus]|nr:hypothetical protein HanRHA438_Chr16g0762891 [Helianthus annuus]
MLFGNSLYYSSVVKDTPPKSVHQVNCHVIRAIWVIKWSQQASFISQHHTVRTTSIWSVWQLIAPIVRPMTVVWITCEWCIIIISDNTISIYIHPHTQFIQLQNIIHN